jgi:hypothetical protein
MIKTIYTDKNIEKLTNFYMYPKYLNLEEFSNLSYGAKILYITLLDRLELSKVNGSKWQNENGEIYIVATITNITKFMNCSRPTAIKFKKELISYGLIYEQKQNLRKASLLYISEIKFEGSKEFLPQEERGGKEFLPEVVKEVYHSGKEFLPEVVKEVYSNKNNYNNTEYNNTNHNNNRENIVDLEEIPDVEDEFVVDVKKDIISLDTINSLQFKFKSKSEKAISENILTDLIDKYSLNKVEYYIDNFDKFNLDTITNPIGYLRTAIKNGYTIPEYKPYINRHTPIQSTNFDQRGSDYYEDAFEAVTIYPSTKLVIHSS